MLQPTGTKINDLELLWVRSFIFLRISTLLRRFARQQWL